jgi:hypothetical protein
MTRPTTWEECLPCTDPKATVNRKDDIALCDGHWNSWLARYLGAEDQPCAAHLIRQ